MKAKQSDSAPECDAKSTEKAAKPAKKHCHYGHRQRMRERFFANGLEGFQDHEILEMLLFYAIPRRNTNEIAHELLAQFHTFSGVLDASLQDLKQVDGVSDHTAAFLKMLPQLCSHYLQDKRQETERMDTHDKLCEFICNLYVDAVYERVLLICLDESLHLLHHEFISSGSTEQVVLDTHKIVRCATRHNSTNLVLAHNHPHGSAMFSDADAYATKHLKKTLDAIQIKLLDHVIVGRKGETLSMRRYGFFG